MNTVLEDYLSKELEDFKKLNEAHIDLNSKLYKKINDLENEKIKLINWINKNIKNYDKKQNYATSKENAMIFKSKKEVFKEVLRYLGE